MRGGRDRASSRHPVPDPLADGPTIQRAGQRALDAGMTPPRCLEILAATRERLGPDVPLMPMTYVAIVERYGVERFCADAAAAGATRADRRRRAARRGRGPGAAAAARNGIDLVQLVALTSRDDRIELACRASRGFVYVVAAIGTTGARDALDEERLRGLLARVARTPASCRCSAASASRAARRWPRCAPPGRTA